MPDVIDHTRLTQLCPYMGIPKYELNIGLSGLWYERRYEEGLKITDLQDLSFLWLTPRIIWTDWFNPLRPGTYLC